MGDNRIEYNIKKVQGDSNVVIVEGNFSSEKAENQPANISFIIKKLSEFVADLELDFEKKDNKAYGVEDKLKFNHVRHYDSILEEYFTFGSIIEKTYSELNKVNQRARKAIYRWIKTVYIEIKIDIISIYRKENIAYNNSDIDIIRIYSDEIIKKVIIKIKEYYKSSINDEKEENKLEYLNDAFNLVIYDALINCRILEKVEVKNDSNK